ncbi:CGNR zinc finger domain-containing protein [Streptomyces sp. ME02-8801-2C]|uniref:CGNR zinc finger domain-containing protein n=1 Tax=Streptomyces sp. ME02-8801-2C TaxID=3028680 RepID=UPI0029B7BD42|nr:CGNR zinc finger domain-containing protein [Streptomyces sp. ME02-8801-2C]MDX3457720.1 CGNR zinc finger domain-containing protein [Streptomyces sp. ME02-8801-2C]
MSEIGAAPGGLALVEALVNTRGLESGRDALNTAEGRAPFGIAEIDERELAAVKELRESLRAVCLAHAGHPPHDVVIPLGQLLSRAPLLVAVDERDGSARLIAAEEGPLLSRVAAAVAEALTDGTWLRLKACELPECHWAYYDRSPAGRRRWCSMAGCGARAKMRRYRAK